MFRRRMSLLLVFVMMIGAIFSSFPMGKVFAENYINFSNSLLNNTTKTNPYELNSSKIDMDAALNNVDGTSISYTIEQIVDPATLAVGEKTTNTKAGIIIDGSSMKIVGLKLFAGLNRITFNGNSGGAAITQQMFVRYIDAPTVYNLTIFGGGRELLINDTKDTVVTPEFVSNVANGTIFVKGNAPNVKQVTINIINVTTGTKKGVTVSVSSTDSSFTTQALQLSRGKNRMQIILQNDDQYTETYRDLVYYDGSVTFYNENLINDHNNDGKADITDPSVTAGSTEDRDSGESSSVSLRANEPFNILNAVGDLDDLKISGKVIVPNNYSTDIIPLRVNAVYMQAKDFAAGGTSDVDAGEQIVIEFNKAVDTSSAGGAPSAGDINSLLGFYYVNNENTSGEVIEIPALDELDPTSANQSTALWVSNTKYVITIGAADVEKFRNAWISTNSTTRNKPFVVFKKNVNAQDGSEGPSATLNVDLNSTPGAAGQLTLSTATAPQETIDQGDVLLIGDTNSADASAAVTNANANSRWVIFGEAGTLSAGTTRDQLHVVGKPGTILPENARIINTTKQVANGKIALTANPVLDNAGAGEQVIVSGAATQNTNNTYNIPLSQADGGAVVGNLTTLVAGDLVRFYNTVAPNDAVYGIVVANSPTGTIQVYAPVGTIFTTGYRLEEVTYAPNAAPNSPIGLGNDTGRVVGEQVINSFGNANGRLSLNVGSDTSKAALFAAGAVGSGDLLKIGSQYAVVGLPFNSADGTSASTLGDTNKKSISSVPIIGLEGSTINDNDAVVEITASAVGDFTGANIEVNGAERVGMDGKIKLTIDSTNFTSTNKITRGDRIRIGDATFIYAIAAEDVTSTATSISLVATPGALIPDNADVKKVTTEGNSATLAYANGQISMGTTGNLSYFAAGSFDSTKPSIIKATINANVSGTFMVDSGESINVVFQDPKQELKTTSNTVSSTVVVEGKEGTSGRATLSDLKLQNSVSWIGNSTMQIKIDSNGNPFFKDYGYISLNGNYPDKFGSTVSVGNIPVTGTGATAYAMVLLGNTFDGDARSPKPDVNNLLGITLNPDGTVPNTAANGTVPNYVAKMVFMDGNSSVIRTISDIKLKTIPGENYKESNPFFVFQYESYNPSGTGFIPSDTRGFGSSNKYLVNVTVENLSLSPVQEQGTVTGELSYYLEEPNKPFFYDVNFLATPSYSAPLDQTKLLSSSLGKFSKLADNTTIYNTPFAINYMVIDPSADDLYNAQNGSMGDVSANNLNAAREFDVKVKSTNATGEIVDMTATASDVAKYFTTYTTGTNAFASPAPFKAAFTTNANGDITGDNVLEDYRNVYFVIKDLPFKGSQTLTFTFEYRDSTNSKTLTQTIQRTVTYVSGPFVAFDAAYDNQVISLDTTETKASQVTKVVETALGKLRGELRNVQLTSTDFTKGNANQKVFLYVNNNEIPLKFESTSKPNRFNVDEAMMTYTEIYDLLNKGENKITFFYKANGPTTKESDMYKKELVVKLVSTNIPVIPVPNTDIFPYPFDYTVAKKDPKRFPGGSGVYSTLEKKFDVFGTFDFIDLGATRSTVETKLATLQSGSAPEAPNYILDISKNDGTKWTWDLTKRFTDDSGNVYNTGSTITPSGLSIGYVKDSQTFTFTINDQDMPKDGSKVVYTIKVFNGGLTGPYALYTLEVSSTATPYNIIRPTAQELAGSINRNYVEVVIEAKGADEVVVDKVKAEKIDFDSDNDGTKEYSEVFRAVVTGLKPNKKSTVKFTITKGTDKTTGQFDVMYAEDFIPGAEYLEAMKNQHKVFGGGLELTFPKNTYLRRMDPKSPNLYKTQVYADHSLLFGIANPEDGVVNRYDYVPRPSSFQTNITNGKQLLQSSYDSHFIQISPMYWVDGGLADDPNNSEYDDVKQGFLPHQLPSSELSNFNERQEDRMVVPTQRGKIKLSYNKSVVADASQWVTVFRFDPDENTWTNVGGIVDPKSAKVTANFDRFGYYVVGKLSHSFTDVSLHPYARNHAEAVYVKGVLKPRADNEFGVDVNITRAEFATMIVRALGVPLNFDPNHLHFDDIPLVTNGGGLWDYRYIETAANMGILRGASPRIFEPNNPITREDASVILARALSLKQDTDPKKIGKDMQKLFKDYNLISAYSRPAVLAIAKKKYVNGSPIDPKDPKKGFVFEPQAYLLRGDASIIMANIMKDLKLLPPIQSVR